MNVTVLAALCFLGMSNRDVKRGLIVWAFGAAVMIRLAKLCLCNNMSEYESKRLR